MDQIDAAGLRGHSPRSDRQEQREAIGLDRKGTPLGEADRLASWVDELGSAKYSSGQGSTTG